MGTMITLTAADGHVLDAYQAGPDHAAAALVVIQEVFGVNGHIRDVCDRFAAQGFSVVAPALFDRAERGVQLGYTQGDVQAGLAMRARVPDAGAIADIAAAAAALGGKPTGIVGYCWGGRRATAPSSCSPPGRCRALSSITAGMLQICDSGTVGSIADVVAITADAPLALDESTTPTLGMVITGDGILDHAGSGITVLTEP